MRTNYSLNAIALLCTVVLLSACVTNNTTTASNSTEQALRIEITTHLGDKQEYREGDEIYFLLNLNRDAYLLILYKDSAEDLWQLVPNDFSRQFRFKTGLYIPIPGPEQRYRFRASAPFGKETLFAYAAETPFPLLPSKMSRNGMQLLDITIEKLEQILHGSGLAIQNRLAKSAFNITTLNRP